MKNILLIIFTLVSLSLFSQSPRVSFNVATVAGTDTTLYYTLSANEKSMMIDFSTFNAATATIDLGFSKDKIGFISEPVLTYPYVLDTAAISKTANGVTTKRLYYYNIPSPCVIAIKLTLNDVTTGTLKIWY